MGPVQNQTINLNDVPITPFDFPEIQTTLEVIWKDKSYLMDIKHSPNPSCNKSGCHGRGYTGFNITSNKPVMCKCTMK